MEFQVERNTTKRERKGRETPRRERERVEKPHEDRKREADNKHQ